MSQAKQTAAPIVVDLVDEEKSARESGTTGTADVDEAPAVVVNEDADVAADLPKRAVANPDGSVTLPLREPVTLTIRSSSGGVRTETYAELTLHRLRGADIRAIQSASKETQGEVVIARSSRIRETIMHVLFDKLDGADIADAGQIVTSFLGSGRTNPA